MHQFGKLNSIIRFYKSTDKNNQIFSAPQQRSITKKKYYVLSFDIKPTEAYISIFTVEII